MTSSVAQLDRQTYGQTLVIWLYGFENNIKNLIEEGYSINFEKHYEFQSKLQVTQSTLYIRLPKNHSKLAPIENQGL